jgi:hypothetical protein
MVRANRPGYGPIGALRVERVTKSDGRYVLYYSWPGTPASPAEGATSDSAADANRSDGAPLHERANSPKGSGRSDGRV